MKAQFARIEAYSVKHLPRLLGEVTRDPRYCSHVQQPDPPRWHVGSVDAVESAVGHFMEQRCPVHRNDGKVEERKRRDDSRGLVAGFVTFPYSLEEMRGFRDLLELWRLWAKETIRWLRRQFDKALVAIVSHFDESHPHIHFIAVGDANRLHPGLNAEFEGSVRIASVTEKRVRHSQALRNWLDEYQTEVAARCGFQRRLRSDNRPRIRDRATALRVLALERAAADKDALEEIARVHNAARRPRIKSPRG